MKLHYDADDYLESKNLLESYLADYNQLLAETPALKVLSFDAYVSFIVNRTTHETTSDFLFDIFDHLRKKDKSR